LNLCGSYYEQEALIEKYPGYKDAEMLLKEISKKEKKP
jgi:hypothetical protein